MSETKDIPKGQLLFQEGAHSDCMYIVIKGRLAITKRTNDGDEIILTEIGDGGLLGELSFIDRKVRSAGARAVEDSQVLVLSYESILPQYQSAPDWLKAMLKTISYNLRKSNERIRDLELQLQEYTEDEE